LVQSRLDYANSIMYGMSASNTHKLQSVQNSLTHEVLPSFRHLSANERLSFLYWLPVHYRIQFKIATLTYKTLATCRPSYLYIISSKYTSHHVLSILQPRNFYHTCPLISIGVPSATALLQQNAVPTSGHLATVRASDSCFMTMCALQIFFLLLFITTPRGSTKYRHIRRRTKSKTYVQYRRRR